MKKLTLNLQNCYGIEKLNYEFDYSKKAVNLLYARNGLMKTSLTKTFNKLQNSKKDEICDELFSKKPVLSDVKIDGKEINQKAIFVIESFQKGYESDNIASLLVNNTIKQKLKDLLVLRNQFFEVLERYSGLKIKKTTGGKQIFELEDTLNVDLNIQEDGFLIGLSRISLEDINYDFSSVPYAPIFASDLDEKIKSNEFQLKIDDFLDKTDEIYKDYTFLEKGKFTLPKLKKIEKELKNNKFFVKGNKIILSGEEHIENVNLLKEKIKAIESQLQQTKEFKAIEKILSTVKGTKFMEIIENNPEIIQELKIDKFNLFKKKLWLSYIKTESELFDKLKNKYFDFEKTIETFKINHTPWKDALDIFNSRFTVPFKMEIGNLKSSIIGESMPKILFSFCKDGNIENLNKNNWLKINRNELEEKNTLSQGERRALYLLNVIFDIENRKLTGEDTLFIVDDIADSFDYKNKYAIVEYLKEISEYPNFYMLILSHNFDFYRTLSSRLDISRENKFMAYKSNTGIMIEKEYYQKRPFTHWMNNLTNKNIIALIPFVRNLIEFGVDKKINDFKDVESDEDLLTNLLHVKKYTEDITIGNLKRVFKEYIGKDKFTESKDDCERIYKVIEKISDNINDLDVRLENKIILSISTRLKSEQYMIKKLNQAGVRIPKINSNQTRKLYELYSNIGNEKCIKILDKVNIMTPESIHLNSFMYEPIIDMDIIELKKLYEEIKKLE